MTEAEEFKFYCTVRETIKQNPECVELVIKAITAGTQDHIYEINHQRMIAEAGLAAASNCLKAKIPDWARRTIDKAMLQNWVTLGSKSSVELAEKILKEKKK